MLQATIKGLPSSGRATKTRPRKADLSAPGLHLEKHVPCFRWRKRGCSDGMEIERTSNWIVVAHRNNKERRVKISSVTGCDGKKRRNLVKLRGKITSTLLELGGEADSKSL